MPTLLRVGAARFFFYSLEGSEPPHVHVEQGAATAKFWLEPLALVASRGFAKHELNRLRAIVLEHRLAFREAWDEHFAGPA